MPSSNSRKAVVLKPPLEPEPSDCCGSGCARCVWDIYYDKLAEYEEQVKLQQNSALAGEGETVGANDDDDDEEEGDSFYDLNGVDTHSSSRKASQEPPTASSLNEEASNSNDLFLKLIQKKLPHAPKSTGSIVVRYADDHNGLSIREALELVLSEGRVVHVRQPSSSSSSSSSPASLGEGKCLDSSSVAQLGCLVAERGPPNSAFVDCLIIKAEHDRKMILDSGISETGAVNTSRKSNNNTTKKTNGEDVTGGANSERDALLIRELNSLQQEVNALRKLQTTVVSDLKCNINNYTGNWARIVVVERLGARCSLLPADGNCVEGAGVVEKRSEAVACEGNGEDKVLTDTTQAVGFSQHLNPLVGLRLGLSCTAGDEDGAETVMPGDVVEILAPNDTDLCVAILKRLKLTNPARRVTLVASPFASPNGFPGWLAPASVAEKICSIDNVAEEENEKTRRSGDEFVLQKAKALESSINGLLQAQQQREEERLTAIEAKRDGNSTNTNTKREGEIGSRKTFDEPISPELDLGTVSARSLLSVFKHYVDVTTSAYLRPTFFAMLCRAAEASVGRPLPATESEAHELISSLPFVKKARDTSAVVSGGNGSTSPSSSSATDKLTDFVLLRFLATGAPPRVLSMFIAEQKPSMLTILEAFPTVTPQLPRLLEVCTPLRPRMFSVAGRGGGGGGGSPPHVSVDIFIRAFGSGPLLSEPSCGGANDHQEAKCTETLEAPTPKTAEATPSQRLTNVSASTIMSPACAARDFRLAVEKLFLDSQLCAGLNSGSGDNLEGPNASRCATTDSHFIGHTSGRLVQEMLRPSTTCNRNISHFDSFPRSSVDDVANTVWARVQRIREQKSSTTLNASHTQNKQLRSGAVGLFPSIPADKPLILVGAGSGYAPLRAVLRERLSEASAYEDDICEPTSSTAIGTDVTSKKKRCGATVLLCSVRTVEEAFAIDKLISEDIYEILGHTTARGHSLCDHAALTAHTTPPPTTADIIGTKRGRDSNSNEVNTDAPSSHAPSSLSTQQSGTSTTNNGGQTDIEDIHVEVRSTVPHAASTTTTPYPYHHHHHPLPFIKVLPPIRVERHFFISSFSSSSTSSLGALQSKAQERNLGKNALHYGGNAFFHEGRLVDWYSPSGAGIFKGRRALCRFPSAMAACMLFAAVSGSATSPRDSSSSLSGLTRKRATNCFSFSPCMWPERNSSFPSASSTSTAPNSSFFDRTVAAVAKKRDTGACGGFVVEGGQQKCGGRGEHRACENCPRRCLDEQIGIGTDRTAIGKQSYVLPNTRDAHIYACGPEVFLASVYKGLQHLLEWGPTLEAASSSLQQQEVKGGESGISSSSSISSGDGGSSGGERSLAPDVDSNTGISSLVGEYDLSRPPLNDESEAEYEMRKHFFNKHIIFDYWKE